MSYQYTIDEPYCLLHGFGHWTKVHVSYKEQLWTGTYT